MNPWEVDESLAVSVTAQTDLETITKWREISEQYSPLLRPGKRDAASVLEYLRGKYPTTPIETPRAHWVAASNAAQIVMQSDFHPSTEVLRVENQGDGQTLYQTQEQDCADHIAKLRDIIDEVEDIPSAAFPMPIVVYAELTSGYVGVEGSPRLHNELIAYQGLSRREMENPYLVVQYVDALRATGQLEAALAEREE